MPAEEYSTNDNNINAISSLCKLKIKDILVEDIATIWYIEDMFAAKSLYYFIYNSSTKTL